jgi:hypothetical protein
MSAKKDFILLFLVLIVIFGSLFFVGNKWGLSLYNPDYISSYDDVTYKVVKYTNYDGIEGSGTQIYDKELLWSARAGVFNHCVPDLPEYEEFVVGSTVGDCSTFSGTTCRETTITNIRKTDVVYANKITGPYYADKPRQHPDCVEEIKNFVESAGLSYESIIYLCPDGTRSVSGCEGGEQTTLEDILSSQKSLFKEWFSSVKNFFEDLIEKWTININKVLS